MKKLLVILSCLVFSLSSVAYAANFDLSSYTDDELRDLRTAIEAELSARQAAQALESGVLLEGAIGDYHVALMNIETSKDYKGDPVIVLTYMFTNNSDEAKSFMLALSDKVYQNGVELQRAISLDVDTSRQMLEVKNGASIEVPSVYCLADKNAPIEVEIEKVFDFSRNPVKLVGTFAIAK